MPRGWRSDAIVRLLASAYVWKITLQNNVSAPPIRAALARETIKSLFALGGQLSRRAYAALRREQRREH